MTGHGNLGIFAIAGDIGSVWSSLQMLKMPSVKPWCAASVCGRVKRYTSRWWPWPEDFIKWMADDIEGVYILVGWLLGCLVVCLSFVWLFGCLFDWLILFFGVYVWKVAIPKHPCLWAEIHLTKFQGHFLFMEIFTSKTNHGFIDLKYFHVNYSGTNSWKDAHISIWWLRLESLEFCLDLLIQELAESRYLCSYLLQQKDMCVYIYIYIFVYKQYLDMHTYSRTRSSGVSICTVFCWAPTTRWPDKICGGSWYAEINQWILHFL